MKFFNNQEKSLNLKEIYLEGKKMLDKYLGYNSSFETFCILNFCFNVSREDLIENKRIIDKKKTKLFFELIKKRLDSKPLQYILGFWYFMDKKFFVEEGVLIPREETEILVKSSINLLKSVKSPKILELCAGSGIISIMLKKNIKNSKIDAVEISEKAISCMKKNIKYHSTNIKVIKENVLEKTKISKKYDIIISNPPYIPTKDIKTLEKEIKNEPKIALDGGKDGFLFYKNIIKNYFHLLKKDGKMAFEVGINQHKVVKNLLSQKGFKTKIKKDFNNIERVILAHL